MVTLSCIFRVGCVLLSVCATFWPIHLFYLDEDSLEIELKDFHSSQDTPYPLIRLCFDRSILHENDNSLSTKKQSQDGFNPGTLHIEDYISRIVIVHANKTRVRYTTAGTKNKLVRVMQLKLNFEQIILQRFLSTDCLDIGVPFTENEGVHAISVAIRKGVFKEDAVPTRNEIMSGTRKLRIGMSYLANSFRLPSYGSGELLFDYRLNRTCSGIAFSVNGIEVLQQRNKPSSPCTDYDSHGLYETLHQTTNHLGCMPTEWEIPSTLPYCLENVKNGSTEPMFSAMKNLLKNTNPCRSIQDVQIEYNLENSFDGCKNDAQTIQITAVYNGFLYKEIRMVRSFNVWNLLSSLCIINGLFYGAWFMKVPKLLKRLRNKVLGCKIFERNLTNSLDQQISIDQRMDMIESQNSEVCEVTQNTKKDIAMIKNQIMRLVMNLQKQNYEVAV